MNPFAIVLKWFGWQDPHKPAPKFYGITHELPVVAPDAPIARENFGNGGALFHHVSTPGKERWRRRRQRTARQRNFSAVKRQKAHS